MAQALGKDEQLATQWLHNLINSLPKLKIVPVQIAMIVSALFIKSPGKPWSDQSLRVLQSISKADPQQVQVDIDYCSYSELCVICYSVPNFYRVLTLVYFSSLVVACLKLLNIAPSYEKILISSFCMSFCLPKIFPTFFFWASKMPDFMQ